MQYISSLIYKIVPLITKKHTIKIRDLILHSNKANVLTTLQYIDNILVLYKRDKNISRQNWICTQIIKYFELHNMPIPKQLIDIGGGNGNVLDYFATKYGLAKDDCICIEKTNENVIGNEFQYTYSHANTIQYMFLDNDLTNTLKQVDCIFCMVSLHHMTNEYITTVIFPLIQTKLKPNGYLLLKEHNADTNDTHSIIQWEHNLYYLMEQKGKRTVEELQTYLNETISNYKSRDAYQKKIETDCGCKCVQTLNNVFEPNKLDETPTKLYWQIFQKI